MGAVRISCDRWARNWTCPSLALTRSTSPWRVARTNPIGGGQETPHHVAGNVDTPAGGARVDVVGPQGATEKRDQEVGADLDRTGHRAVLEGLAPFEVGDEAGVPGLFVVPHVVLPSDRPGFTGGAGGVVGAEELSAAAPSRGAESLSRSRESEKGQTDQDDDESSGLHAGNVLGVEWAVKESDRAVRDADRAAGMLAGRSGEAERAATFPSFPVGGEG